MSSFLMTSTSGVLWRHWVPVSLLHNCLLYTTNKFSWNQISDYMEKDSARAAIQPGLKILARFSKPGQDFQPGQTDWKIWKNLM